MGSQALANALHANAHLSAQSAITTLYADQRQGFGQPGNRNGVELGMVLNEKCDDPDVEGRSASRSL